MKYLTLKCNNGSIIIGNSYDSRHDYEQKVTVKKVWEDSFKTAKIGIRGYRTNFDLDNVVPATMVANILRKLCGEIPIPTKHKTYIGDYSISNTCVFDDIARNSYIKIDGDIISEPNEKGTRTLQQAEIMHTRKTAYNATNSAVKTVIKVHKDAIIPEGVKSKFFSNGNIIANGHYDWSSFVDCFNCDTESSLFKSCIRFFEDIVGYYPMNKPFLDFIYDMSKFWNTDFLNKKLEAIADIPLFNKVGKQSAVFLSPWRGILLGCDVSSYENHTFSYKRTLNAPHGIAYRLCVDAELIVPLEEEHYFILDKMKENGGTATFLDSGFVYIAGIGNYEPVPNFRKKYDKIY